MYGSIFNRPRNFLMRNCGWFRNLITCSLCTGFWCGVIMFPWHCPPPMWEMDLVNEGRGAWNICKASLVFPYACYSAITCYIGHLVTEILLAKAYPSIEAARCPQDEEGIDDNDYSI